MDFALVNLDHRGGLFSLGVLTMMFFKLHIRRAVLFGQLGFLWYRSLVGLRIYLQGTGLSGPHNGLMNCKPNGLSLSFVLCGGPFHQRFADHSWCTLLAAWIRSRINLRIMLDQLGLQVGRSCC